MISALRAPAERANALLKRTWKALERITLDPCVDVRVRLHSDQVVWHGLQMSSDFLRVCTRLRDPESVRCSYA
jgi:hypothetical protein